jgi:quercetin dioxygenase-like cupin family protein
LIFALYEHPDGVNAEPGNRVIYDLERNTARFGAARTDGPALAWALHEATSVLVTDRYKDASLVVEVELDPREEWLARCDRVDFPPGGVAYWHVHPGLGIRRLLFGELTIDSEEDTQVYGPGEAWFEGADFPVLATSSSTGGTAFVRVLLLPAEWAGKRTIRYLDPADEDKPKLQRAAILLEEPLRL